MLTFLQYITEEPDGYKPLHQLLTKKQHKVILAHPSFKTYIANDWNDRVVGRVEKHHSNVVNHFVIGNQSTGVKHVMKVSISPAGKLYDYSIEKRTDTGNGTMRFDGIKHWSIDDKRGKKK